MTNRNRVGGIAALYLGHMAGTIDLAALPLWIGALMAHYRLPPEQAGVTVTLFLTGIVIASAILAPRFDRLRPRWIAALGFGASAICFLFASRLPVAPDSFGLLLVVHGMAGLCTGSALTMAHGSIGRTNNPHRHFGLANVAVAVLAILMFAFLPGRIAHYGGQAIFVAFAITMAVGGSAALLFFPQGRAKTEATTGPVQRGPVPIPSTTFLIVGAVVCLMLNQSMVFAFVERIGAARGFGGGQVQMILIALGFINLLPGVLAALLQKRLPPLAVGIVGPLLQAALAITLTNATAFPFFAAPTLFYASIVLFTHTFLFGILSRVDPSGRAVAATPAMMMTGAAIGPAIGGGIVATVGFEGIGWSVLILAAVAVTLMLFVRRALSQQERKDEPAGARRSHTAG